MVSDSEQETEEPLYQKLAGQLMQRIDEGEFREGDLLPSEHELSATLGLSRQTVRAAMDVLRRRGLIESRRGIGTRVLSRARNLAEIFSATSINDLAALVQNTELQIEQRSGFALSLALAARFGAEAGSRWLYLGCRRHDVRTDQVVAWTDTYIPRKYEMLVGESRRLAGPLFTRILASEARSIGRIRQEIRAVALTKAISRQIEADAGSPALEIQRSYYFDNNNLFQVAINTLPANRFHYASELVSRGGEIALD